jgi:hypothetical protein
MTRTRLLRASSGRRCQVSTTVTHHLHLYAHTIANDIFTPYLDGLFDITNRIAEEGKMVGHSLVRKISNRSKYLTARLMKMFLFAAAALRSGILDPLN